MILYHFATSPFARRARLTMALKGLSAELRDPRVEPSFREDVQRLNPTHTVPVLVDGDVVLTDSSAICQYLDRKVPEPPLFPAGLAAVEAYELVALVDSVLNILIDLGLRYAPLHGDSHYPAVREMMIGRVQRTLSSLAERVTAKGLAAGPICAGVWSAADIALLTLVLWLEGMPARAESFAPARTLLGLGWSLPPVLSEWANQHRNRPDVLALG